MQGIIVGAVLAFLTAQVMMNAAVRAMTTTVNGWSTTMKSGQPGNGLLLRAACARTLPAVNVAQEAAYWTTTIDSAGRRLCTASATTSCIFPQDNSRRTTPSGR